MSGVRALIQQSAGFIAPRFFIYVSASRDAELE